MELFSEATRILFEGEPEQSEAETTTQPKATGVLLAAGKNCVFSVLAARLLVAGITESISMQTAPRFSVARTTLSGSCLAYSTTRLCIVELALL